MKVKPVQDRVYDGEVEPVMVILTEQDKKNIANMIPKATKYCMFPGEYTEDIEEWMRDIPEKETI